MNGMLYASLITNIALFSLLGYLIKRKGGLTYLKTRLGFTHPVTEKPFWYYKGSYHWKVTNSLYYVLPVDAQDIIFLGDSIVFGCEWAELFNNPRIKNRGINGDNTEGILERIAGITRFRPKKIFIEIGTNDIALNTGINEICENYSKIIDLIRISSPETIIYMQSVLPTNNYPDRNNHSIIALNKKLESLAMAKSVNYLHLFESFTGDDGNLSMQLSFDGLHLNGQGYLVYKRLLEKYVND